MAKLLDTLKRIIRERPAQSKKGPPKRRDPQFVGRSSAKEIENAPPERVGELVGHAVEHVDT